MAKSTTSLNGQTTESMIRQALKVLFRPGQVIELRAVDHPRKKAVTAGFFTDRNELIENAVNLSGRGAVYVSMNELHPGLVARINNRVQQHATDLTGDGNVIRRRWFLIDTDPERPSNIPATNDEHRAGLAKAREVRCWLRKELGFPAALRADSGNGGHTLYAINEPNDAETKVLLDGCLEALALRFSDNHVKIDTSVTKAGQMVRLYGCQNCKGDGSEGRPHRPARLLHVPGKIVRVTREQLEALAAWAPDTRSTGAAKSPGTSPGQFELAKWIADHNLQVASEAPWKGGRKWVLSVCPFNESHTDGKAYIIQTDRGSVIAGCFHDSCRGKTWRTLRGVVDPGWQEHHQQPQGAGTKKKPRPLPPYRPFPVEALPKILADYASETADAVGCDPALVALPALAATASMIGATYTIRLKDGWEEPAVLWTAVVALSGQLKSPAAQKAIAPVHALQHRLTKKYERQCQDYERAVKQYRQAHSDGAEPPEEPILQRVVCADTTIERLSCLLDDNRRGLLVARDELNGWLSSFTRYKGGAGATDMPLWLEFHRAGPLLVDRKSGDKQSIMVRHAAVCVTGSITPGVLAKSLSNEHLEAGLGARLLMAMPPPRPRVWTEATISPQAADAYRDLLERLSRLDFAHDDDGQSVPRVVKLSREAKARWIRFYNFWGKRIAAAEGELAAALSKLEGAAARFALVHHLVSHPPKKDKESRVELKSILAGIKLCKWFGNEASRIYTMLGESESERSDRRLVEYIHTRGGRITVTQLQRSNNRRYRTAADAESALQALVNAGAGEWQELPSGPKGGRPSRTFTLHDETDETPRVAPSRSNDRKMHDKTLRNPCDTKTDTERRRKGAEDTARLQDDTRPRKRKIPEKSGVSSVSSCIVHGEKRSPSSNSKPH
jgi:hypothetical protein